MSGHYTLNWEYNQPYAADAHFQLFEAPVVDGVETAPPALIVDNIGELYFSVLIETEGTRNFYVRAVVNGFNSELSNSHTVNFMIPAAPENLRGSWDELLEASVSGSVG